MMRLQLMLMVSKAQNSAIAAQNDAICIGYHKK
jgi:hypothetical protein